MACHCVRAAQANAADGRRWRQRGERTGRRRCRRRRRRRRGRGRGPARGEKGQGCRQGPQARAQALVAPPRRAARPEARSAEFAAPRRPRACGLGTRRGGGGGLGVGEERRAGAPACVLGCSVLCSAPGAAGAAWSGAPAAAAGAARGRPGASAAQQGRVEDLRNVLWQGAIAGWQALECAVLGGGPGASRKGRTCAPFHNVPALQAAGILHLSASI